MKSIVLKISVLFCLFISYSAYSEERKYTYYIEWNEVKGNNGYKVEVRKISNPEILVAEEKTVTSSLEFLIPAGEYEFRISALNRFGKPSSWSQWSSFQVEQDRPKSVVEAEKKLTAAGGFYLEDMGSWFVTDRKKRIYQGFFDFFVVWCACSCG